MHGPLTPRLPHVDVHPFAPRAPGEPATLIIERLTIGRAL